jgi:uncharacterized alpha-E superfamily protein
VLSRVANSLYWMSRYLERAENIARLVDVNLQLLLDFRKLNDEAIASHWRPIVQSAGDEELFRSLHKRATGKTVTEFMVFQSENTNSIVSSIAQARENARMVRDQITSEFWEELNRLYLFLQSPRARSLWNSSPFDFFQEIKNGSLLLQGLFDATIVRNEGWSFVQAGRFLERADKTSRILDVRHSSLPAKGAPTAPRQADVLGWSAVLRSCSAWDAYKAQHGAEVQPPLVAEFLLLSDEFPRSVRFCVRHLNTALRRLSGVREGRYSNDAEKLAGRLLAELQFSSADDIFSVGLHDYVDALQSKLNQVGEALFQAYIFQPFQTPDDYELRQQEEQQQQSPARVNRRGRFSAGRVARHLPA